MSCIEYKTVLRAEIPLLKGLNNKEALCYYRNTLGEPEYVDEDDDEVNWFEYEGKFQPVYDWDNKKWGIDLVLEHRSDYETYIESDYEKGVTLKEFKSLAEELYQEFNVAKEDIRLIGYSWYNGGSEPIHL